MWKRIRWNHLKFWPLLLNYNHHNLKILLPPANDVCEGYVFTGVCLSTTGGACVVALGGHAWLLRGGGHAWLLWGCAWFLLRGHAWFFPGGVHGFFWGVGGMHGFFWGGVHGFSRGVRDFFWGACVGYDEIRSMSGRYTSYWNAFLFYRRSESNHRCALRKQT